MCVRVLNFKRITYYAHVTLYNLQQEIIRRLRDIRIFEQGYFIFVKSIRIYFNKIISEKLEILRV